MSPIATSLRCALTGAMAVLVAGIALPRAAQAEPTARVSLAVARQAVLHRHVVGYGTVSPDPNYVTTLALPREGIIAAVAVRAGQIVKVGDPIATVETAPAAAATYQQAKSAVAFAAQDLAHTKALYGQQLATRSQLASAEKAYADAKAQLQAQNKIGAGQHTQILRATAPGIVTMLKMAPGDRVSANAMIAAIATRDRLLLDLGLEPEDALHVPVGAKVILRSPQTPEIHFAGVVESVNATVDATSRLVNAVVRIPQSAAGELILGMLLEGRVALAGQSGIVVPHQSLMTDKHGTYVFVVENGVAHRRNVKIRLETADAALIAGKISAGARVVVSGNAGIDDGTHVRTH